MIETIDKLNFEGNPEIKKKIGEENIFYSDKLTKIATEKLFSKNQERNILITNLAVYNFKGFEIKRRIKVEDLKAITVSKTSDQFIIHCNQNEYDYLFISKSRKKIIKTLQSVYEALTSKDLLFCQKQDKDLTKFVVGKKERTKNPYLFKIEQSELTSIKDYIDNDSNENEQEDEPEEQKPTPPPAPKPAKVESASTSVKVVSGKGKGVPPPPPPPPPPPVVATTSKPSSSSSKPVDLAAELAAKKKNLAHVEVKEYVSPALQKPEEGGAPQTGNSMMAAIMAKRNQMKKIGGGGAATGGPSRPPGTSSGPKLPPAQAPKPRPSAPVVPNMGGAGPKPMGGVSKPTTSTASKFPAASSKPPTSSASSKPPMKMGGGGGGGFAAKMAALQARMGGAGGGGGGSSSAASSAPVSNEPSKPIVELCAGNTKRMDINKVIGNLEKEKKKQAKASSSKPVEVKVVSGKGKGSPPPPPPPPPPPKIK